MRLTLKQIRALMGYTQEQVAAGTGLDIMTISRIERGRDPRYSTLQKLCDFYGVGIETVLIAKYPTEKRPQLSDTEKLHFDYVEASNA